MFVRVAIETNTVSETTQAMRLSQRVNVGRGWQGRGPRERGSKVGWVARERSQRGCAERPKPTGSTADTQVLAVRPQAVSRA